MMFKIITFVLMATFYVCYFAKMISQRRQGIETDQLGKGKEGFVRFIEISLKTVTYLVPVIQVISIWLYAAPAGAEMVNAGILDAGMTDAGMTDAGMADAELFDTANSVGMMQMWQQLAGVIMTAAGVTAFVVSVLQMKDNWRAGVQREEKTELVTTGIYAISRNPAFLGFDLMYVGILVSFFNWYLCVVTVLALVLFHLQIVNVEEEFLVETFGEEYLRYKKRVCRYLVRRRER